MNQTCSINGCNKPTLARALCSAHYGKWYKYKDPLASFIAKRGEPLRFLAMAMNADTDACIHWPFKSRYSKGYGALWFRGRLTGAHRAICIMAHGKPPLGCEAAHSCGQVTCVNPRHLRWASGKENAADKIKHGTYGAGEKNPAARLREGDVREILKAVKTGETHRSIAGRYGVSREAVTRIVNKKVWRHVLEHSA